MKPFIYALFLGCPVNFLVTGETRAQQNNYAVSAAPKPAAKDFVRLPVALPEDSVAGKNFINAKAIKYFKRHFKISNEKWAAIMDGFTASFDANGKTHTIYFDEEGRWKGTLKTYPGDLLPGDIKKLIKWEFSDYRIIHVDELKTNAVFSPTYIIMIRNNKFLKIVKVNDEFIELSEVYK